MECIKIYVNGQRYCLLRSIYIFIVSFPFIPFILFFRWENIVEHWISQSMWMLYKAFLHLYIIIHNTEIQSSLLTFRTNIILIQRITTAGNVVAKIFLGDFNRNITSHLQKKIWFGNFQGGFEIKYSEQGVVFWDDLTSKFEGVLLIIIWLYWNYVTRLYV